MSAPDFKWEVRHEVVVRGYRESHESISQAIGLIPTRCIDESQPLRIGGQTRARVNVWAHVWFDGSGDTDWMNNHDHRAALAELIGYLVDRASVMAQLASRCEVYLKTVVSTDSSNASYSLDPSAASGLARLGLGWVSETWLSSR
ncbi:MAG: hypothetical protein R3B68_14455 [Phycisphaerales bacterium]